MPAATGNTAPVLTSITIFFFCWALFTFALRLWVKLPKSEFWSVDDTVVSLALVVALFNVIATCYAVNHGFGVPWTALSDPHVVEKLTRLSNSLFTAHFVTHTKQHVRMAHTLAVVYVAWTVGSLFAIAIRDPIKSPWQTRDGSRELFLRWAVVESAGCVLDLGAVAFSTYLVWTLQMPLHKRLSVIGIFATRLLILPIIAVRLWKLWPVQGTSLPAKPNIMAVILTEIAMETALNLASITCMKPFLRPFQDSGYIVSTSQQDGPATKYSITGSTARRARSRSESYHMLGTAASSSTRNKDGSIVHTPVEKEVGWDVTKRQSIPCVHLRGDAGYHEAACEHDVRGYEDDDCAGRKTIRVSKTVQIQRHDDR